MPKILIMVLTYMKHPYDELYNAQVETWDAVDEPDVRTIYYHGNPAHGGSLDVAIKYSDPRWPWRERVMFNCTDQYYYMTEKFRKALEWVKDWDYDFIFRTNSSSYVSKKRLKEFAATLPKEKLYAGWTFVDSEDFGGLCVSGAGIFLSRDTADILRESINPEVEREEDVEIGRILRRNGITAIDNKSRLDWTPGDNGLVGLQKLLVLQGAQPYHIRFKTGNRLQDAENMRTVHQQIISQ